MTTTRASAGPGSLQPRRPLTIIITLILTSITVSEVVHLVKSRKRRSEGLYIQFLPEANMVCHLCSVSNNRVFFVSAKADPTDM